MKCSMYVDGFGHGMFDAVVLGRWRPAMPDNAIFAGDAVAYRRYLTGYRFAFITFEGGAENVPVLA